MQSFINILITVSLLFLSSNTYCQSEAVDTHKLSGLVHPSGIQKTLDETNNYNSGSYKSLNKNQVTLKKHDLREAKSRPLVLQATHGEALIRKQRFTDLLFLFVFSALTIFSYVLWQTCRHKKMLSETDVLTNIPNRRGFRVEFEKLIEESRNNKNKFAFGILDLDRFKQINDSHGFKVGDQILIKTAKRLQQTLGNNGLIGRLGGDEFAFLLNNIQSNDDAEILTKRILNSLTETVKVGEHQVIPTGTIGLAIYPDAGETREDLHICADYALHYKKKLNAHGEMQLFDQSQKNSFRRHRQIEETLNHPNLENELYTVYQPINCAFSGATLGFEALARWQSNVLGNISPAEFIPMAERTAQIHNITLIILRKALADAKTWRGPVWLTINLSSQDLGSLSATNRIKDVILNSGFPTERIVVELTETAIVLDTQTTELALHELRKIGVKIALDDFGTGYSSLKHVTRFPINLIKIDSSLTEKLMSNNKSKSIIELIINMCDQLNLKCIVEGVENDTQVKLLRLLGARYLQGYHFSNPLEAGEVHHFLSEKVAAI